MEENTFFNFVSISDDKMKETDCHSMSNIHHIVFTFGRWILSSTHAHWLWRTFEVWLLTKSGLCTRSGEVFCSEWAPCFSVFSLWMYLSRSCCYGQNHYFYCSNITMKIILDMLILSTTYQLIYFIFIDFSLSLWWLPFFGDDLQCFPFAFQLLLTNIILKNVHC